jgi:hypothetical protein
MHTEPEMRQSFGDNFQAANEEWQHGSRWRERGLKLIVLGGDLEEEVVQILHAGRFGDHGVHFGD